MKKTKQQNPTGKLMALIVKYNISEELALALGQEAVAMAQRLFQKWKNNSIIYREKPIECFLGPHVFPQEEEGNKPFFEEVIKQ